MKFKKRPVVIDAVQWFKNGDHPLDYSLYYEGFDGGKLRAFTPAERKKNEWEGDVVRYYRIPDLDEKLACGHCAHIMRMHGWIDTLEGGHIVCPGDWIITGVKGEHYPCKPDIFEMTYEQALASREGEALALDIEEFISAKKYQTTIANPEEMDGTESVSVAELREFMHRRVATASPQVVQEPVASVSGYYGGHCVVEPIDRARLLPVGMALYSGAQAAVPECVWEQDTDEDLWDTSCGAKWQFITDGPEENNVHYCHQCGGKVIHKERTE